MSDEHKKMNPQLQQDIIAAAQSKISLDVRSKLWRLEMRREHDNLQRSRAYLLIGDLKISQEVSRFFPYAEEGLNMVFMVDSAGTRLLVNCVDEIELPTTAVLPLYWQRCGMRRFVDRGELMDLQFAGSLRGHPSLDNRGNWQPIKEGMADDVVKELMADLEFL